MLKNQGTLFKYNRLNQQLTLKELGNKVHISAVSMRRIENNIESPSPTLFHELCKTLNIDEKKIKIMDHKIEEIEELFFDARLHDLPVKSYISQLYENDDDFLNSTQYYKVLLMRYIHDVLEENQIDKTFEKNLSKTLEFFPEYLAIFYCYLGAKNDNLENYESAFKYYKLALQSTQKNLKKQ